MVMNERTTRYHRSLLGRMLGYYESQARGGADPDADVARRLAKMKWGKVRGLCTVAGLPPWEQRPTQRAMIAALLAWAGSLGDKLPAVRKSFYLYPAEQRREAA